ncbi:MAG: very short patch repair endonuclease [Salinarimonas sp.]
MDAEARSRIMRAIRKTDTKPELIVRRALHARGLRFRLHRRDLPGSPDIVMPRHCKAIFVHGCFWHQHPGCRHATRPRSRQDYWEPKLDRNVARDARARDALAELGWDVLTLWECEVLNPERLRAALDAFLPEPPHRPSAP